MCQALSEFLLLNNKSIWNISFDITKKFIPLY